MKENKGKEVVGEGKRPKAQSQDRPDVQVQVRPTAGDEESSYQKTLI